MNQTIQTDSGTNTALQPQIRRESAASKAEVLADIYQDEVNLSVWQRTLTPDLVGAADSIIESRGMLCISTSVTPIDAFDALYQPLGGSAAAQSIAADIAELVAMFCCLFELKRAGLRFTTLDRAMCPKFHVDRVPCRLISTYSGIATEWLPHDLVKRSALGQGGSGKTDQQLGVYASAHDIRTLCAGEVSLLKGESWLGNEGGGLVHRSPSLSAGQKRLLLTLDFN